MAVACGVAVGVERQLRGKPAGMRTSALICLGSTLFVSLGVGLDPSHTDQSRVLGQVVTGVGFLGAGVILTRQGIILGMTSASVIWILAAIGCAIGVERYAAAGAVTLVTLLILAGLHLIETRIERLRTGVHTHDHEGPRSTYPE
jgi:putative Mg2+ transporter-C (MgtC) family protein